MINNYLLNYTTWSYDSINQSLTALRGHKYHILPTNVMPITLSFTILIFLMILVFNFHNTKSVSSGFDLFVEERLSNQYSFIFGHKAKDIYLHICITKIQKFFLVYKIYPSLHFFWVSGLCLNLGLFFLWCSNAIEEGITSKITVFSIYLNNKLLVGKVTLQPLFHSNLV
jgi:hypothetical protein